MQESTWKIYPTIEFEKDGLLKMKIPANASLTFKEDFMTIVYEAVIDGNKTY